MNIASSLAITLLVLAAAGSASAEKASALERGVDADGYTDAYFGVEYPSKGIAAVTPVGDDRNLLFRGRTTDDVEIEIFVNETAGGADKVDWLARARRSWAKATPVRTIVAEGAKPVPWAIVEVVGGNGVVSNEGFAFYTSGNMKFIVHAWVPTRTTSANDSIEAAIGNLRVSARSDVFLAAHILTRGTDNDPRAPQILAKAASLYLNTASYRNFELAAEVAEVARRVGKGKMDDHKMWQVNSLLGIAQLELGEYEDAAATWERCVRLAPRTRKVEIYLPNSYYNLAASYAQLGRSDEAFDELDVALKLEAKNGLHKLRGLVRTDQDFAKLHTDARWRERFSTAD